MSTDITTGDAAKVTAADQHRRSRRWTGDLRAVRIIRFAVGVTVTAAISFALNWPLFFLTPLFTAFLLSLPLPAPTLNQVFLNILHVFAAFVLGAVFTLFLLPFPLVYVPALGLALFRIYYLANRGGPMWLVLVSLIAILLLPMLGTTHELLASGVAFYFIWSSSLAVVFVFMAHHFFPDPPSDNPPPASRAVQTGYSRDAALNAMKSTIAVLPLAILFIAASWTGQILILVFAAIFSLLPELSAGKAAGLNSLKSTAIGGLAALLFYWTIVAVPELHFFIALMFLTTLLFGMGIFSDSPNAKYISSGVSALIALLGSSMGEDVNIADQFVMRIILLGSATLYVVAVLSVLDRLFSRVRRSADL